MATPIPIADRIDRFRDIVQIVERFTHAHEHDIGQAPVFHTARPFLNRVAGNNDLAHNFLGGQIAHQLLRAGMTEGAIQRAADLARDAQSAGFAHIWDEDALAFDTRLEPHQPFLSAVDRDLMVGEVWPVQMIVFRQLLSQVLRDIGHRHEILAAHMMGPAADLFGAHTGFLRRHAKRFHLCFQRRQGQACQAFSRWLDVRFLRQIELDFHAAPIPDVETKCTRPGSADGCALIWVFNPS